MCLEFDFTYANFNTIDEPPIVFLYINIYIYIYENYNRNYLEK